MSLYTEPTLETGVCRDLAVYRGKVLLIVNTASRCGFTPQYAGLQKLYASFVERGFAVLGFPCDQFGHQEPGTDAEIQGFCSTSYDVTFPVYPKIEVNGGRADPLFVYLKNQKGGLLGRAIKWNFTKFLVAREGDVLGRYAPTATPQSLVPAIEAALG